MRHASAVSAFLLAALAAGSPSSPADLDAVKTLGELRVLAVVDDPKDEFFTDRPGVGLDRELLESFASFQKVKLVVVPVPGWDKLVPMLQENRGAAAAAADVPPASVNDQIASGGLPAALRGGQVTAIVLGIENAITERRKDPELQVGAFLGPPGALAWAVRKEDAALLAALDDYIAGTRRTPTWGRLVVKYFGEEAPEILKRAREEAER